MGLTLGELLEERTKEDFRAQLLDGLKGLGHVLHTGSGPGTVKPSGVPTITASVVVEIVTAGALGVATFQYSTNGGESFSAPPSLVPVGGSFALPNSGVSIVFAPGPAGTGTPFVAGDTYEFELSTPNFPVTAWQPFSAPLTQVEVQAEGLADFARTVREIAGGGFVDEAAGDWLTLLAENMYGLERKPGVRTRGKLLLTDAANAGPFNLAVGQLWALSASGKRFTNVAAGVIPLGGSLSLDFEAESPGADYNVANGTIQTLATPLPGVTVDNPDAGAGTWITNQGANPETDAELAKRCKQRWPELAIGATADGYEKWAKDASASVTQVLVRTSPTVAGQVDIYVAGPAGAVGGDVVTAVDDYIKPRVPLTSTAVVLSATNVPTIVAGNVTVEAAHLAAAQAEAAANLEQLFQDVGIGGTLHVAAIIEQVMKPTGVKNVVLSAPAADLVLAANQIATLTNNLVWVAV